MQQSNAIFGFLFIAFLVFITMKGELPIYLGFLFGSGAQSGGSVTVRSASATGLAPPANLADPNTFVGPLPTGGG